METWKILLITVLSAVVLGCILGVVIGKYLIKKARPDYKPLLSLKERIIYFLCIAVGAGCVLIGIFVTFPSRAPDVVDPAAADGLYTDSDGVMAFSPDGGDAGEAAEGEADGEIETGDAETDGNDGEDKETDSGSGATANISGENTAKAVTRSVDAPAVIRMG